MTDRGEVALVLHTHLPWVAGHGVWPVGEEWLFQAWGHAWLPVTGVLQRLAADGLTDVLTLGVTPTVAAQVADERLARDLATWLGGQTWRAEEQRWHHGMPAEIRALSTHHWTHHAQLLELHDQVQAAGGLLAVWADLASRGVIELLGGPATHPYLPLMDDPAAIDGQLAVGLAHHAGWAGAWPSGIWPPELGYRPAGPVADPCAEPERIDAHGTPTLPRTGPVLGGLEEHYARAGVDHVMVDAPTLIRAAGGAERDWTRRPPLVAPRPDRVEEVVHDGAWIGDADVAAFARDLAVAYRVWSPSGGYPGNAWYRDFHALGGFGTHRSWRVTGLDVALDAKAAYEPDAAAAQVPRDVADFVGLLRRTLDPRPGGLVVAAYDTELFGHWWYEGPTWLEQTLRAVADDTSLRTTTLASRLARRPPTRRLALPESSWGYAKGHASWVTPETRPMWQAIRRGARLAGATARAGEVRRAAQAARELAQLRASDWPFMVTRGNAAGYAHERVADHLGALQRMGSGEVDDAWLAARETRVPHPADPAPLVAALAGR